MRLRDSGAGRRGPGELRESSGDGAAIVARSRHFGRLDPLSGSEPKGLPHICAWFAWVLLLFVPVAVSAGELPYFNVLGRDAGSWPQIFASVGFQQHADAHVFVARAGSAATSDWPGRIEKGAILVLEGESPLAESLGFKHGKGTVHTTSLRDVHRPALPIIWEKALELPVMDLPAGATVFARERWMGAPMTAGVRRGAGASCGLRRHRENAGTRGSLISSRRSRIWASRRLFRRLGCGRFSIRRIALVWIWITSRRAGANPASRRCMWRRGTSMSATRSAMNICESLSRRAIARGFLSMRGSSCRT